MAFTMTARRWVVAAAAAAAVALPSVRVAARQNLEYQVKAAFLYNFLTFIEPDNIYMGSTVAEELMRGNPRFNRERFLEACETGRCKGMGG